MNERISSKEIEILSAFDRGESIERIAEMMEMTVTEIRTILDTAIEKRKRLASEAESSEIAFVYYRPIDATLNVPQKGTMKVGSQILKLLSEGIYSSPANSIKEIINNAFDADAEIVKITFDSDELVVWDNGKGMDYKDFDEDFVYISQSRKRKEGDYTRKHKRPIIGFIGIGFIAVSELCDVITIKSAKEGSDLVFEAKIDFSASRAPEAAEREFYEVSQFELTNYKKTDKGYSPEEHFTEIRLQNLRPLFKEMLQDRRPFESSSIEIVKIMDYLEKQGTRSLASLGEYWHFLLQLAYITPVTYLDDGPVKEIPQDSVEFKSMEEIKARLKLYDFKVIFEGVELKKPILFPIQRDKIVYGIHYKVHPFKDSKIVDGKKLTFFGYIYSQHGSIRPKEYNGIITRIRNVAIGNPDTSLFSYPLDTNLVFRHWVFGEIYVTEGLEEAMTIDRSSFKLTHPHYQYLQEFMNRFLDEVFHFTDREYYRAKKARKRIEKERLEEDYLTTIIEKEMGPDFSLELSTRATEFPVVIDNIHRKVVVNRRHSAFRSIRRRNRPTLEQILVLLEIAAVKCKGDLNELRKMFLRSTRRWF